MIRLILGIYLGFFFINVPLLPTYAEDQSKEIEALKKRVKALEEKEGGEGEVKSWVLRPNEPVCVFGIWNHGELLPSSKRPDGLPLYEGTQTEVSENLKDTGTGLFAIGGFLLAVSTVWLALTTSSWMAYSPFRSPVSQTANCPSSTGVWLSSPICSHWRGFSPSPTCTR